MNKTLALVTGLAFVALACRGSRRATSSGFATNAYEQTRNQSVTVDGSKTTWRQTAGAAPQTDKLSIAADKVTFHVPTPKDQPKGSFGGTDALPVSQVKAPDPVRALVNYFTPDNDGAEPL